MKTTTLPRQRALFHRLFAAAMIALLAVFTAANAARAHDELVGSTPESGATLSEAPSEITLNFSGPLQTLANDGGTVVVISNKAGDQIENTFEVEGRDLVITPSTALVNDQYTVASRVISSDGHPIEKVLEFTVNAANAPATDAAQPEASATPTAATEPTDPGSDAATARAENPLAGISPLVWIIVGLALAAAAVAVLVNFARRNNVK